MKEAEIFSRYIYLENNPILSHHTTAKTPSCRSVEHKTCFTPVHNHLSLFEKNTLRNRGIYNNYLPEQLKNQCVSYKQPVNCSIILYVQHDRA